MTTATSMETSKICIFNENFEWALNEMCSIFWQMDLSHWKRMISELRHLLLKYLEKIWYGSWFHFVLTRILNMLPWNWYLKKAQLVLSLWGVELGGHFMTLIVRSMSFRQKWWWRLRGEWRDISWRPITYTIWLNLGKKKQKTSLKGWKEFLGPILSVAPQWVELAQWREQCWCNGESNVEPMVVVRFA